MPNTSLPARTSGAPVTRFAPSPTGYLHIGGARTALFNLLYARHHGGTFLLRIEDTDRARSTDDAIRAILDGMAWMGLDADEPPVFQFARAGRHAEVAHGLIARGRAYRCYATPEELEAMRAEQKEKGLPQRYDGRWREQTDWPENTPFVVRLKAPTDGEAVIEDRVQGRVTVQNSVLDDFVLLRSDGTPTYMLAVVVDDHDMGVTHVIRGDDHLSNAFRQLALIRALEWPEPVYAHVPMIHGPDGAKLSKRHGALGVEAYRDELGILPEALENYLLRLGWGHGDAELLTRDEAVQLFDLDGVGRSPAKFDLKKLESVNAHYLKAADDARLVELVAARLSLRISRVLTADEQTVLLRSMPILKIRSNNINELAASAEFLLSNHDMPIDNVVGALLTAISDGTDPENRARLQAALDVLTAVTEWRRSELEQSIKGLAADRCEALGKIAAPLRLALTGQSASPGVYDVLVMLGRDESLGRIGDALGVRP